MINIFNTEQIKSIWTNQSKYLEEYYSLIEEFKFNDAIIKGNECLERFQNIEKSFEDEGKDDVFNDSYFFKTILYILIEYATYWYNVFQNECSKSWNTLQNTQDYLRILNKFTRSDKTKFFRFFENQAGNLEKIYPYSLFASIEAIYSQVKCSICGKNMDNFDCPHIRGELYRGRMASGIVKDVKHLCAVSLVTDPQDKRCVISYPDSSPAFNVIHHLSRLLTEKQLNPFNFSRVEFRKIDILQSQLAKIGRNEYCPCGSGKKYKSCCLDKALIKKDHIDIIVSQNKGILPNNLVHLT